MATFIEEFGAAGKSRSTKPLEIAAGRLGMDSILFSLIEDRLLKGFEAEDDDVADVAGRKPHDRDEDEDHFFPVLLVTSARVLIC